jgi:hypothetical protein
MTVHDTPRHPWSLPVLWLRTLPLVPHTFSEWAHIAWSTLTPWLHTYFVVLMGCVMMFFPVGGTYIVAFLFWTARTLWSSRGCWLWTLFLVLTTFLTLTLSLSLSVLWQHTYSLVHTKFLITPPHGCFGTHYDYDYTHNRFGTHQRSDFVYMPFGAHSSYGDTVTRTRTPWCSRIIWLHRHVGTHFDSGSRHPLWSSLLSWLPTFALVLTLVCDCARIL